MDPLVHLAIIWVAVYVAVVAAKLTRLTAVLFFLFIGCALANFGILPAESGPFIRIFAELGIIITAFCLNILVPLTITWWRPHYLRETTDT